MKVYIYNKVICLFSFFFLILNINAQKVWIKKGENQFILNTGALNKQLKKLNGSQSKVEIIFPSSKGELILFNIYDNAVLPKALAEKFPQVHSYKGVSENNASQLLRFTCTPGGIEGILIQGNEIINLTSKRSNNMYQLVNEEDNPSQRIPFRCGNVKSEKIVNKQNNQSGRSKKSLKSEKSLEGNNKLKIIRLAITTTGEVSDFFVNKNNLQSGSINQKKAAVLAGISTSVSNVNVAFERDLGVRFELISDNDKLIFLDGNSDPYEDTPNNLGVLIDQGADAIKTLIPLSDYDLGHIIAINGNGGLAAVGSVCSDLKGQAATGFGTPEGFFFDFTLFAHELGHQLGANHTQNASCEREFTSVETGSGTTIMGYSGACGNNDVQSESDPFFHSVSIIQIVETFSFLDLTFNCGVQEQEINNTLPTISVQDSYSIPVGVPFSLTAEVFDADGDDLTYSWEQIDSEIGLSPPGNESTVGPQFRTFSPTETLRRDFPSQGVDSKWEVLPTVARFMNFNLTVRDGNIGGVAISDPIEVSMVETSGDVEITFPVQEISFVQNSTETITWEAANTTEAPFNVENVSIELSYDGGETYPVVLLEETPNTGSADIKIPIGPTSDEAKIRVNAINNIFFMQTPESIKITDDVDLTIGPNPSNGQVNFKVSIPSTNPEGYSFQLFNLNGKLIFEGFLRGEEQEYDFIGLSTGLYIVRIDFNGEIEDKKIIIVN